MKSPVHPNMHPGNKKLKGKKIRPLSCGCCVMLNLIEEVKEKEAKREIEAFKSGKNKEE